jgi:hypothetical protein
MGDEKKSWERPPGVWVAFALMVLQAGVFVCAALIAVCQTWEWAVYDGSIITAQMAAVVAVSSLAGLYGWQLFFDRDLRLMHRD